MVEAPINCYCCFITEDTWEKGIPLKNGPGGHRRGRFQDKIADHAHFPSITAGSWMQDRMNFFIWSHTGGLLNVQISLSLSLPRSYKYQDSVNWGSGSLLNHALSTKGVVKFGFQIFRKNFLAGVQYWCYCCPSLAYTKRVAFLSCPQSGPWDASETSQLGTEAALLFFSSSNPKIYCLWSWTFWYYD